MESTPIAEPSFKTGALIAIALAVIHIGLALWFASMTPYRHSGHIFSNHGRPVVSDIGSPDERQHANYVNHLLQGKGFPVFSPTDPTLGEDYQFHQPPAFYLLETGWAKLMGVSDVSDPDSGLKLRAFNALLGGANVFLIFCLGAWGFRKAGIGLCAAAIAAFLPMNIALSGAISNDPLLFTLCTAALAICARGIWEGWPVKRALILGVVVGLALLTKTTAIGLLPIVLLAVLLSGERPKLVAWAAAAVPMLMLPIGWWIRNQSLYGDPFAIKAFNQAFVQSPQAAPMIQGFGVFDYLVNWVGWWTLRSFYGAFGYMDIWLNETGLPTGSAHNLLYRLLVICTLLLLVGWGMSWKQMKGKEERAVGIMNLSFGVIVAFLFLSFNLHYFQAQARYLFPAIAPICVALGTGAVVGFKGKWQIAFAVLVLVFGGLAIYAGIGLGPAFDLRTQP